MAEREGGARRQEPSGQPGQAEAAGGESAHWTARKLLRSARVGTLATQSDGQPFAGLVSPATAADLTPLLLLSELSEHTKHLRRNPRCALMVAGSSADANPQTMPRVTLTATAVVDDAPTLRARYLAVHPYADLYAGFGDFHLWRLAPTHAFFVGGFARARTLRWADLTPAANVVSVLADAAASIINHCNADHPDALATIAGLPGPWRMVGVDSDGCDLAEATPDSAVLRVSWPRPVDDLDGVRRALILLARAARAS